MIRNKEDEDCSSGDAMYETNEIATNARTGCGYSKAKRDGKGQVGGLISGEWVWQSLTESACAKQEPNTNRLAGPVQVSTKGTAAFGSYRDHPALTSIRTGTQ